MTNSLEQNEKHRLELRLLLGAIYRTYGYDFRNKIVFATHNLATDGIFGEMHLIFCCNILIYFNKNFKIPFCTCCTKACIPADFYAWEQKRTSNLLNCPINLKPLPSPGGFTEKNT